MESRVNEVVARHQKGYNCAQSVACAYCELVGADEQMILKAVEALGRGVGNTEGTCGVITGAAVIAGLKYADGNTNGPVTKEATYEYINEIVRRFKEANGTIVCKELKALGTKSCGEFMKEAGALVEAVVFADK